MIMKIKIDSYEFVPPEKTLTLRNAIILIKSVINEGKKTLLLRCIFRKMFI